MSLLGSRNKQGLSEYEIRSCLEAWEAMDGSSLCPLDTSEAHLPNSRTRFNEIRRVVFLGADVSPGLGLTANARISSLACLCHEKAHCERYFAGYDRPVEAEGVDFHIDEAETSLRASFDPILSSKDREDLVEDARDHLIKWLATPKDFNNATKD